ncbi:hypothetical protein AYO47_00245 [Planctomyces sp. SCGC AG-212-M04]|nr:hypothetical protein AYO47_00245 [Planctomyces sp. SCGC AG-212-M04]
MPLTPVMADLDAVRKAFGCKDRKLLKAVLAGSDLDDDDTDAEEYELEYDDDDDPDVPEELPSSQDALRHIIMGEPWARGIGSKYGYAFLVLCQHLGKELDRTSWGTTSAEYDQAFDLVLAKLGVKADIITVRWLSEGSRYFPLPESAEPVYGTMPTEKVAQAAAALAQVDRAALEAASQGVTISRGDVETEFVIACFDELRKWCQITAAAGNGLIVFHY